MSDDQLRRRIAFEAARLLYQQQQQAYHQARRQAAQRLAPGKLRRHQLPTNRQIRDSLPEVARMYEGQPSLRQRRQEALRLMKLLWRWRPRLLEDPADPGDAALNIAVFSNRQDEVCQALDEARLRYEIAPAAESPDGLTLYLHEQFAVTLTIRPAPQTARDRSESPREGWDIKRLQARLAFHSAEAVNEERATKSLADGDRFEYYKSLLLPLERVPQDPQRHPEGDALYHSLQVFDLARAQLAYDEEFLLAALLHDVGKAIDRRDPIAATLDALGQTVTPRTQWLIAHHHQAQQLREGTLGVRSRRRLEASENFEELMLLCDCDRRGRAVGVRVPDVDQALDYLRQVAIINGE